MSSSAYPYKRSVECCWSSEECAEYIYKAIVKRKRDLLLTFEGKMAIFLNKWFPGLMDKIIFNKFAKEEGFPSPK